MALQSVRISLPSIFRGTSHKMCSPQSSFSCLLFYRISQSFGCSVITGSCCGNDYWSYKQRTVTSVEERHTKASHQDRLHTPRSQVTAGENRAPSPSASSLDLLSSPGRIRDSVTSFLNLVLMIYAKGARVCTTQTTLTQEPLAFGCATGSQQNTHINTRCKPALSLRQPHPYLGSGA